MVRATDWRIMRWRLFHPPLAEERCVRCWRRCRYIDIAMLRISSTTASVAAAGAAINLLSKDSRSGWSNLPAQPYEAGSSSLPFRGGFMTTQRHIDALRTVLRQIRTRLTMLESVAPPELRDRELRRRISEVKIEESVALSKLMELGVEL